MKVREAVVPAATVGDPSKRLYAVGARGLSDAELLALVLTSGARPGLELAYDLLGQLETLARVVEAPMRDLTRIEGVGPSMAARLLACAEIGRRVTSQVAERVPLRAPRDVWRAFQGKMQDLPVEEFHVALLDAQHRMFREVLVTRGILNSSLVHPREIFVEAVKERAAAVILVHNHPSGETTPSADDRAVTEQMVAAGRLLDIPVHDHVIIGKGTYLSFAEAGLL